MTEAPVQKRPSKTALMVCLLGAVALSGCGGGAATIGARIPPVTEITVPSPLAVVGDAVVFDTGGNGKSVRFSTNTLNLISDIGANSSRPTLVRGATTDALDTYTLFFRNSGGEVTLTVNPGVDVSGTTSTGIPVTVRGLSGITLDYAEAGVWRMDRRTATVPDTMGGFHFGVNTSDANMPNPGGLPVAAYNGQMIGYYVQGGGTTRSNVSGTTSLTATFGGGNILTGSISGMTLEDLPGTPALNDLQVVATINGGRFEGTVTANVAPGNPTDFIAGQDGPFEGVFYGLAAEELGAAFRLIANNKDRALVGSVGAAR